ncbi:secreted protein [Melampsora americana]|nr:secreted protein [Melampsora americana]
MLSLSFAVVVLALSSFSLTLAQSTNQGQTTQCTRYSRANTTQPSCNERYTCAGECTGPFITAQNCLLITDDTDFLGRPKPDTPANSPVTNVICNVGYGRNTAAASACLTDTGTYSCNGGMVADTYATCYECIPL